MTNIKQALQDLKDGKLIVVLDDLDRENEGDLIGLPEFMDDNATTFMVTHGRGLLCAPISSKVALNHNLTLAPTHLSDGTNFTLSIDSPHSITGISPFERREVLDLLMEDDPIEFKTPGHSFPLIAKDGGLSVRKGHTEAGVDLAKIVGTKEVAAIIEIIGDDGKMMRGPQLIEFSKKHNLTFITIEDLIIWIKENKPNIWNKENAPLFFKTSATNVETSHGIFKFQSIKDITTNKEYLLILNGNIKKMDNPKVRVHSACLTSEAFHSYKCDCKDQLDTALNIIAKDGGAILYTPDEGRGIGLFNKISAYGLQENGADTVQANIGLGLPIDDRDFETYGKILSFLGFKKIQLLTNNPEKINAISKFVSTSVIPIWTDHHHEAEHYIKTKKEKMGHRN